MLTALCWELAVLGASDRLLERLLLAGAVARLRWAKLALRGTGAKLVAAGPIGLVEGDLLAGGNGGSPAGT